MKNKTLLKPLLYSVLILILLGTMVYQIAGNPEASVFSSLASAIGILFMGIVRTIQWLFAMLIALAVCLAFLFALFLGAIALFDKAIAAQMYQNLKSTLLGATAPFTGAAAHNLKLVRLKLLRTLPRKKSDTKQSKPKSAAFRNSCKQTSKR